MSAGTTTECTLGNLLRETRLSRELSLRRVADTARVSPMYLSLLERDECGPPSDEKLLRLSEALGEPHAENFFAKAGRVTPQVVSTILRHPTQWSELIETAKDFDADHLAGLKYIFLRAGAGKTDTAKFMAKFIADLSKSPSKVKAGLRRDTKERAATSKRARVGSVRRAKRVRNAPET